jgi:hypothetical protein
VNAIGITVCVNYGPILEIALKVNSLALNHIYVITKEDDLETINVCKRYDNVELLYHDFKVGPEWFAVHQKRFDNGQMNTPPDPRKEYWSKFLENANSKAFNKGSALRMGQENAATDFPNTFQLILDCDIVLSDGSPCTDSDLESDILYTPTTRKDFNSLKDFRSGENFTFYKTPKSGWGFFQLYRPSSEESRVFYDEWHSAAQNDVWFRDDIINKDFSKLRALDLSVSHLGQKGESKFEQKYKFKIK